MGLPSVLLLVIFYRAAELAGVRARWNVLLTLALGFGTLIFSYSGTMNNHTPAAFLIFASYYLMMKAGRSARTFARLLGCGVFSGLGFAVEAIPGFFFGLAFFAFAFLRFRSRVLPFIIGAAGPLALYLATNFAITGTAFPADMYPERMLFPGSLLFRLSDRIYQLPGMTQEKLSNRLAELKYDEYTSKRILEKFRESSRSEYSLKGRAYHLYHMLAGSRGYFSLSPVLILALSSLLLVAVTPGHLFRSEALAVGVGLLGVFAFHAAFVPTLGGQGFGNRFLLSTIPTLFFFNVVFFKEERFRPARAVFYVALCLSVAASLAGSGHPWMWSFKD